MKRIHLFLTTILFVPLFAFAQMPQLIKDINPTGSSEIDGFTKIGNTTFFFADDGTSNGYELWRTDGTTGGTQLVQDVNNSTTDGQAVFSNPFSNIVEINGEAFWLSIELTPVQFEYDLKLWKAGATGGATLIKQLDITRFGPLKIEVVNNVMYWQIGSEEIWRSNGTTAGTTQFLQSNDPTFDQFVDIKGVGSDLFFARQTIDTFSNFDNRIDIWKSNGTQAGTAFFKNAVGDAPIDCGLYGVVLQDFDGTFGYLLPGTSMCSYRSWQYIDGIGMFQENHAPISSNGIISPVMKNGEVFYYAYADQFADEYDLKSFDGSQTQIIENVGRSAFNNSSINKLSNGDLIMISGEALLRSDGTTAGTQILKSFDSGFGIVSPKLLTRDGSDYIFVAIENGVTAIWKTDGTIAGTLKITDVVSTAQNRFDSYHVDDLIICGDEIIYSGDNGQSGVELWKVDLNPPGPPPTCDNNLSNNSGFENGFDGWGRTGASLISGTTNSGNTAVQLEAGRQRVFQILPAKAGEEFTLGAHLSAPGGNLAIKYLNNLFQPIDEKFKGVNVSNGFRFDKMTSTAPIKTSWIEVSIYSSGNSILIVDDVCITKGGVTPTCSITTTVSNIQCNDEGTSNNPTDDTFGFNLLVEGTNASNIFRITDYAPNPTLQRDYGTNLLFEDLPISGGDFTLSIEDGFISNCMTTVTVAPPATCSNGTSPAELTIMDNPCTSNFPQQGESTFVDFRIKNTGGTTSVEQPIYLYRAKTCRFCSPINIGSVDVPALLPGEDIVLTVSGIDDGMIPEIYNVLGVSVPHIYYGYFLSDEIAQFPNNLKDIGYYCKKINSDLAIEITTDVPEYDATGEITFKLKARNNGSQTAYNIATYFLDDPRLGLTSLDNFLNSSGANFQTTSSGVQWIIPKLAAGAMQEIELTYQIFEPSVNADYTLEANISSGHNTNTNTSDDSASLTFVKRGGTNGGDLVLFATGDPIIAAWSNGTALFEVTNQSGETFENIQVTFDFDSNIRLVGGNEYTSSAGTTLSESWTSNPVWNIGTMGAGSVKTISLNVYSITNSPMEIYAEISQATGTDVTSTPGNGTPPTVNEDDEILWVINNGTPPIGQPDLTLSNLNLTTTNATAGDVLAYNFDLSNNGNETATGDFTIKSYISTDNSISADDIQDGLINTGNISIGTTPNVPGASTLPANLPQGDYYLILKVDADDEVTESNEGNNVIVSNQFSVEDRMTNPSCGVQFFEDGQFNCIQEEFGNLKVVYDLDGNRISKTYTRDLDLIDVQTSVPNESSLEWVGSTLTKTNSDQSIEYQKTIPQSIASQIDFETEVIEFGNGYVFFGWEDSDQSNVMSVGDKFSAIRTDNNFDVLFQNVLFDGQNSHFQEISFSNIRVVDRNNIIFLNQFRANSFTFVELVLLDGTLNGVDRLKIADGLSNVGGSYVETVCGNFTFIGSGFPLCGSGFCAQTKGGEFTIEGDSIVENLLFLESYGQLSSGSGTTQSKIEYKTDDGGEIVSSKTVLFGGQNPQSDDYRTFNKFDSNGNLEWQETYLIPGAISIRRIFEMNGEVFIVRGTSISRLDCYDQPAPPATGPDLALAFGPIRNPNPSQWSYFPVSLQVANRGTETANDVTVKFNRADEVVYHGGNEYTTNQGDFQHWGDEIWRVGTLAPGASAIITVNYYRLSANGFTAFAEIESMNGNDIDSTPGNGTCCTANENDEAVLQIGNAVRGINNRSAIAENLGNEVFAIVGANPNPTTGRFNVEVFSNENQTSEITIVDILGRPIFRKEVNLNEGHNTIPIELENRGAGMMVVKMTPFHPYLRQIRVMKVSE